MLGSASANAQDSVSFTIRFLPQTVYTETINQRYDMHIDFDSSSQEIQDKIKESGAPVSSRQLSSRLGCTITTARPGPTGHIPVVMDITDTDSLTHRLLGLKAYGKLIPDGLPQYDSVECPNGDTAMRSSFLKMANTLSTQIPLPNAKLAIGGSYTQVVPIKIPIGPMAAGINEKITYTLKNVTGGIAHFTLTIMLDMNATSDALPFPIQGGGDGTGTMEYDTLQNFITNMRMDYDMRVRVAQEGMIMHLAIHAGMLTTARISPAGGR
ncbi:hypothetical protein EDB95_5070 [Dinghuibacter silviterrae]|uniref:Uncharacterized protein n=2 Tax=Dinghuibacter silviterrae TaxID=1539049 RepID=A0A4R8DI47_9BACT|nr:hypothetical protein EDB95_5070 [Dinghuibacter silviterrae]